VKKNLPVAQFTRFTAETAILTIKIGLWQALAADFKMDVKTKKLTF
jgi:hypothetical protein